jgi:hypothetical protein
MESKSNIKFENTNETILYKSENNIIKRTDDEIDIGKADLIISTVYLFIYI